MLISDQLKLEYAEAIADSRRIIAGCHKQMKDIKQAAKKDGLTLDEVKDLSAHAEILKTASKTMITVIAIAETELKNIEAGKFELDQAESLGLLSWPERMN